MISFFFIIFGTLILGDLLFWLWADRRMRPLPRARWWRTGMALFILLTLLSLLLFIFLGRRLGVPIVPRWAVVLTFVWHLLVIPPVVIGLLIGSGVWSVGWIWKRIAAWRDSRHPHAGKVGDDEPAAGGLSRRQVLGAAAAVAPIVLASGLVGKGLWQINQVRVRRIELALPALPAALDGLTIAHVSDTHVGEFTRGAMLREIAERTNALQPDLILLTGDLINHTLDDLPDALDMVRLMQPRYALSMCEGNHDLFEGIEAFRAGVAEGGVPMLVDDTEMVYVRGRPVQLLGISWGGRRGDREAILDQMIGNVARRIDPEAFPILLAHHPHAFDYAEQHKIPLTLAGHTHGGQLMVSPSLGAGPMMYRYWSGAYHRNGCATVISNGAGNWFPVRINAPAEIVHIILHRA